MENSIQSNKSHKQVNITILIFSKVDFELKLIRWEISIYILKKGTSYQEDTKMYIYVPNLGAPSFIKQTLKSMKNQT